MSDSDQPSLRIWQPGLFFGEPDELSETLNHHPDTTRLSEFIDEFMIETHIKGVVDEDTKRDYEIVRDSWVEFTGDPVLQRIDDPHKKAWVMGMAARPGRKKGSTLAHDSLKKYARVLNACFRATGPYSATCEHARELLRRPPRILARDIPGVAADSKEAFTLAEIEACLCACYTANIHWPKIEGVMIGDWWCTRIMAAYYTGERRNAMHEVRYADLKGTQLTFRASTRKRKVRKLVVTLQPDLFRMIEKIRTPRDLIFEFRTFQRNRVYHWPNNAGTFEDTFNAICREAGLPQSRLFGIHGARRALASELTEAGHSWEAQQALGHSSATTTDRYRRSADLVQKALQDVPALKLPARLIAV